MEKRLKQKDIAPWRKVELEKQGGHCPLCNEPIDKDAVGDHNHSTGKMRSVLHRGCNAMLGKIENNYKRNLIKDLPTYLRLVADYITQPDKDVFHPSVRTEEEKRVRRNKRARKSRQKKLLPKQ